MRLSKGGVFFKRAGFQKKSLNQCGTAHSLFFRAYSSTFLKFIQKKTWNILLMQLETAHDQHNRRILRAKLKL